jgi:hypothetical protein
MSNIVDAFFVSFGLDASLYKKGQKEIADANKKIRDEEASATKETLHNQKQITEGLSSIKVGLLEVLAVVAGGMGFKAFIADSMNGQAALHRMSQNLNMNVKDIEAWGVVAQGMGANAEDAFNALQTVAGGMAEAGVKGFSAFTDAARANGVALQDTKGQWLDNADVMLSIAHRMHQMPRQQAMWLANQMGVGAMANTLLLPEKELQAYYDQAKRIAAVTDQSAANAARLQMKWALLEERFKAIRDTAWSKLEPVLEKLGDRLANWLDKIDWDKVITRITEFAAQIQSIVEAFGGWKDVLLIIVGLKVASWVAGLSSGLTALLPILASTTAGMLALVAAAAALAGYGIHKAIEGTKADDLIGHGVAMVLGGLGNQEALDAQMSQIRGDAALSRSNRSGPRGIRNNNPGNLNYVGQAGAHLEAPGGRFAAFGTMTQGLGAMADQLERYMIGGTDTIRKIVNKYAPASDHNNVNAYIADLMKQTGDSADQKLGGGDLASLMRAIINHEGNGKFISDADIGKGIQFSAQQHAAARAGHSSNTRTSTSTTHIDQLTVVLPNARDAQSMAQQLPNALGQQSLIQQSNRGIE